MTYPDAFAIDRWSSPTWDAVLRPVAQVWDWFEEPIERILLIAVLLMSGCLLGVLATQEDGHVLSARDACVMTVVQDARAFAAVLGDHRSVPSSFAHRSCERG